METAASVDRIWEQLTDFASHTNWMADATEIRFRSDQRTGVGTSFDCDTRFGPLSTTDVITVTDWVDNQRIGVTHSGLVTGTGAFEIAHRGNMRVVIWNETLKLPLHFGGPIGELVARPIMSRVWRANLGRLKQLLES